jgi:NitT/TauT family transport system permease protein
VIGGRSNGLPSQPGTPSASYPAEAGLDPAAVADPPLLTREHVESRTRPRRGARLLESLALLSPVVILLAWEVLSVTNTIDRRFFPAPSQIADTFTARLQDGTIAFHAAASLQRAVVGFALGAVPGIALGLALGMFRVPRLLLGPIVAALYPVPKIAIFPLLLLVFGFGDASKWAIVAIGVFFLTFYNTLGGVLQIPAIYFDVGRNAGASRWQAFRGIAFPASLPSIFTGIRLATGTTFIVLAASEFVGARSGLGYFIWSSWQTLQVERMYVGIIVISVLGYVTLQLVNLLESRVVPWAARR